jgi:hypothetical protein
MSNTLRIHREQQSKTLKPAQTIAPADAGLVCQPARSTPFDIACRNRRTIQRLVTKVTVLLTFEVLDAMD